MHRAGQESGRHVVAIRLSDQLVAALTVAGIDVVRAADHRGASPNLDGAASLVLWVPPPDSSQDISAGLSQVARLLSPEGAALVVTDTTPDNVQGAFAAANLQAQRVAAGHLLPGPALRLTGIERDTATWSLSLSPDGGATTAELSERVEAQLFAALAVGGMRLELDLDHHAAVASVWERAYIVTRRRRALQAADAARSLARRLGGHPPRLSSVRLPSESVPPTIDADGARWIGGGVAEPNPRPAAVAANLRKADDIPAVSAGADALLRCRLGARAPQLRLVLHEFNDDRVFAGIRTALKAAVSLARTVDLPLTVMLLREPAERRSIGTLIDWFRTDVDDQEFVDRVQVTSIEREPGVDVHVDDVWMLTYWTTAVAASRAARAGIIDARRAVYLVQDYEPGFFGWSDESAMAITTYQQGFHHLVNSSPLARYLEDQEGVLVPPDQVFAPVVEVDRFERAAEAWRPDPAGRLRVLFYGRPRHPRNLFRIGLESLRLWIETLDGDERPQVQSAGADHPPYRLAPDVFLQPLGKLSFDEYVELLSRTDLALALMFSPHPGHLSLEPPAAGIPTVTNRFGTYREAWLSGLAVADPDPQALALALGEAARSARGLEVHRTERLPASLGASLDDAIRAVASRL
ncbi:MAG TPA: hypothetical protein VFU17_00780 [Candidatus Limnocylindrales bacterium]|nr:hypothetical protein [Candidatus Limnocylindrales bacterium]